MPEEFDLDHITSQVESAFELNMVHQLFRIADALEKSVEIAQKTLDRINEIK